MKNIIVNEHREDEQLSRNNFYFINQQCPEINFQRVQNDQGLLRYIQKKDFDGIIYGNAMVEIIQGEDSQYLDQKGLETIKLIKGVEKNKILIDLFKLSESELSKINKKCKNIPIFLTTNYGIDNGHYEKEIERYNIAKEQGIIKDWGITFENGFISKNIESFLKNIK
jgi:hypothetical protein